MLRATELFGVVGLRRFKMNLAWIALAVVGATASTHPYHHQEETPKLPTLRQLPRSDWLNVKDGCAGGPRAKGDGKADDTAALQACFSAISDSNRSAAGSAVYMPPGHYVVRETLTLHDVLGKALVGSGEETVLVWRGKSGGNSTMIHSDGISRTGMFGFVLDGRAGCDIGVDHYSNHSLFETRLRHRNQKFLGFGQAGIRVGAFQHMTESAEILYENVIFDSNGWACAGLPYPPMSQRGCGAVALLNFNDYDNVFDGGHFSNNTYGIYNDKMANVYVRNSRFTASAFADVYLAASAGNSVRRCVSQGSAQFIASPARDPDTANPTVIQDNRVDGWTSPLGAIAHNMRGPVTVFDNQFTNGPAGAGPPIRPAPTAASNGSVWILSGNLLDGQAANLSALIAAPPNVRVYDLDLGSSASAVPATPLKPSTSFLKSAWPLPTKLFDVSAFGAVPDDDLDDTAGLQAAIDAASQAGAGAMAYVPSGKFLVNDTLRVSGSNFWLSGSGFDTVIGFQCPPPPPPPPPPAKCRQCCGEAPVAVNTSGSVINVTCPAGQVVVNVTFAGLGNPEGRCGGGPFRHTACETPSIARAVAALCMGKANCVLAPRCGSTVCSLVDRGKPGYVDLPDVKKNCAHGGDSKMLKVSIACNTTGPAPPPPTPCVPPSAVVTVSEAQNVSIEALKLSAPFGMTKMAIHGGGKVPLHVTLDAVYSIDSAKNTQVYNDSGLLVTHLRETDIIHAVHLDTNLNVSGAADGTVLVGFFAQSVLTVEQGAAEPPKPRPAGAAPSLGFLTFVALTQPHDVIVKDDQSVVIADLYQEQQPGHLLLSGRSDGKASGASGRVSIQGAKSEVTTPVWATVDNYHGSLFYMGSFFMEKSFPQWQVVGKSDDFNLTMMGNNFDSTNADPLGLKLDAGSARRANLFANTLSNYADSSLGQGLAPMKDTVNDPTHWLVHAALDDFRRLGLADLRLNHPSLMRDQ